MPRISDIYAALPAITGKIELEYEGELVGGAAIARELIRRAADATFQERAGGANIDDIVMWFDEGGALQVADDATLDSSCYRGFESVPGLLDLVHRHRPRGRGRRRDSPSPRASWCSRRSSRARGSRAATVGEYGRATPEPRRRPNDLFGRLAWR